MFLKYLAFILTLINVTIAGPQLITFKDGKIGVNFLGFSADAGLGGFLTGNAAHGGLSASAGTPFGQRAAAGIGGHMGEGGTFGGAYAGATAGQGISARAGLGGVVGGGGGLGAEASAGGVSTSVVKTVGSDTVTYETDEEVNNVPEGSVNSVDKTGVVQKIKPPKKYQPEAIIQAESNTAEENAPLDIDTRFTKTDISVQKNAPADSPNNVVTTITKTVATNVNEQPIVPQTPPAGQVFTYRKHKRPLHRRVQIHKEFVPFVYQGPPAVEVAQNHEVVAAPIVYTKTKSVAASPTVQHRVSAQGSFNAGNFFDGIFNIPISTLKAVNQFLNQGFGQATYSVQKDVITH